MFVICQKRIELNKEKDSCLHEKTKLKDHIKKYESEFMKQTGRPLAKEDREYHKEDFERYKVSLHLTFKISLHSSTSTIII